MDRAGSLRGGEPAFRAVGHVALVFAMLLAGSFAGYLAADGVLPNFADKDFANYWASAGLAADGRIDLIFGPNRPYLAYLRSVMGPEFPWHNWSYPPHYLLLMMPLSLVGYKAGAMLFLAVTGALFALSVRAFVGRGQGAITLVAVAPLIVFNCWTVQNGFLTSAFLLGTLVCRERRPILAGICLGLMSVKPQLAILLPLLLLMERRWRVLAVAAFTTALLVAASVLAFGTGAWEGYFGTVIPYQARVMTDLGGTFLTMLPSTFGGARLLGLDPGVALQAHGLVAAAALFGSLAAFVRVTDDRRCASILLVATFVVTPYALNYDLGCFAAALALFVVQEREVGRALSGGQRVLLATGMLLPILMMFAGRAGIPLAPVVLPATLVLMLVRAGLFAVPSATIRRTVA